MCAHFGTESNNKKITEKWSDKAKRQACIIAIISRTS